MSDNTNDIPEDSYNNDLEQDNYAEIPEEALEDEISFDENYQEASDENTNELDSFSDSDYENFDEIPEEALEEDSLTEQEVNAEEENYENFDEIPEEALEEVSNFDNEVTESETELETSEKVQEAVVEEIVEEKKPKEPEKPKFDYDELREEIKQPRGLHDTAKYLMSLPILGDVVKEKFIQNIKKETDDVKIRAIRVSTQKEIIAQLKEEKTPYIVTHFTGQENICTVEKDCEHKYFKSVYYEVSNPVTNKNVMLTSHIFHNLTRHLMAYLNEPLLNLGNSPQGFFDAYLPCSDLIKTLEKSNAPQEVFDELNEIKEKIDFLESERFAAVRAKVEYDMSVFEQTEYEKEHNIIPFFSMLRTMVDWGAEDIHIKGYCRPMGVVGGNVVPCPSFPEALSPERTRYYANYLMTPSQQQQFEETMEMDNSFYVPYLARFRCNIYNAQGSVGMVFRVIPTKIRPVEVLGVPLILKKLVFERLGLVLVTGQTGSGKTTTLAAIVEFCNVNRAIHILTLENPVEYVYENKRAIFTQRAIEIDSLSFPMAMRAALREKPDIILIGEMRDPDTIMAGLKAAETGHLVMSTLHTNDAVQTINRIVNTFPPHEQETIRVQVGATIKACVAQRLIPRFDKPGRVCAIEVMLVTPNARGQNTRGYIIRNEVPELYKVVATSGYDGMQSMNMALFEHYKNGVITPDDALAYSDNPDEVTRWMREDMGLGVSM